MEGINDIHLTENKIEAALLKELTHKSGNGFIDFPDETDFQVDAPPEALDYDESNQSAKESPESNLDKFNVLFKVKMVIPEAQRPL